MTEPHSGLRFDIYERIHLSEELDGIKELDEVELLPHIQVVEDREKALLKGNLWLTGKYVGEDDEPNRTLEHFIPVEITLPYNRVNRLEDIRVEIENFDIDLLSARSLNVTGVLSLHGIEMSEAPQEKWVDSQEIMSRHRNETPEPRADSPELAEPASEESEFSAERDPWFQSSANHDAVNASAPVENVQLDSVPEEEMPADSMADMADLAENQTETKQEMVIAFGAKAEQAPFGNLKPLSQPSEYRDYSSAQDDVSPIHAEPAESKGDGLEWKKLFLSADNQENPFRKLRIVIVQKAETIEQIAQRYRVNQREIILYNRLGQQDVEEGQLLYIPEAVTASR